MDWFGQENFIYVYIPIFAQKNWIIDDLADATNKFLYYGVKYI